MPTGEAHIENGSKVLLYAADTRAPFSSAVIRSTAPRYPVCATWWLLLTGAAILAGCGWQRGLVAIDSPAPPLPPQVAPCSLAQVQMRKMIPRIPSIAGVASPFILLDHSWHRGDRIASGDLVSLALGTRNIAAPVILTGRIEIIDSTGTLVRPGIPLLDGSTVRIWTRAGFLSFQSGAQSTLSSVDAASLFFIVKADVPDQTRPSTCDDRLRDGDFVFVRSAAPNVWVSVGATGPGVMASPLVIRPSETADTGGCGYDEEMCRTKEGAPVCVWAPICVPQLR